jgi:hypothetical protein
MELLRDVQIAQREINDSYELAAIPVPEIHSSADVLDAIENVSDWIQAAEVILHLDDKRIDLARSIMFDAHQLLELLLATLYGGVWAPPEDVSGHHPRLGRELLSVARLLVEDNAVEPNRTAELLLRRAEQLLCPEA